MDLREIGCESLHQVYVGQGGIQWHVFLNTAHNVALILKVKVTQ